MTRYAIKIQDGRVQDGRIFSAGIIAMKEDDFGDSVCGVRRKVMNVLVEALTKAAFKS